jgi:KDO2-lipid IV(A) lauroyltransferase
MTAQALDLNATTEPWTHLRRPQRVSMPARLYGNPALHRFAPLRVGIALAHARGAAEWLLPRRRRRALERACPLTDGASPATTRRLARRMLREQAVHTELSWRPWLLRRTDIDGLEHLDEARAGGRGAILAMLHLGPIASLVQTLPDRGVPLRVATSLPRTEPLPTGYVGWWLREQQMRFEALGGRFVEGAGLARRLRRLLEGGEVCLLALDLRGRVEATLLGHRVQVAGGPARLARLTRVAVIPAAVLREGRHVVIRLAEPLEPAQDESDSAFTQRILDALEPYASTHPEQANPQLSRLLARSRRTAHSR